MALWLRSRPTKTGRSLRRRNESGDEILHVDFTKAVSENVRDVLTNVVKKDGLTINRRLKYLSAFVKICEKRNNKESLGYSTEDVIRCLRIPLFHDAQEVRAASLRAIRYLLNDENAIEAFLRANGHHLVCRSLDIVLDNHIERIQAVRLMRKLLNTSANKFPEAFIKCLVAVVNDGAQERDRLHKACLATLSELVLLNIGLCIESGIVGSLLRCTLACQQPRINEALVATILFLLNSPDTRRHVKMGIDLEQVLSPYTDCHFRPPLEVSDYSGDDKDLIFTASKMALLSILRSWPGMIRLCKPNDSGLKSLINILYLPNSEVRRGVIDLLLELFRLPFPEWTDDFSVALTAADSLYLQDDWKLYEGFVAKEGKDVLGYLSENRTNLIENYLALLLLAFIHNGILEALVEVILTGDKFLLVRSTFLLGELLHVANLYLPHECSHHSHCLPTLVAVATSFDMLPEQRHVASAAVMYLNSLHSLKKRGPMPSSLFLDQLIQFSPKAVEFYSYSARIQRTTLLSCLHKDSDDFINQSIKDSQVTNTSRQYHDWDWPLIGAILKIGGEQLRKLDDHNHKVFVRRLVQFYKPTAKLFSKIDPGKERSRLMSLIGCHLMDFLVEATEIESTKCLEEFLMDFGLCLGQITAERCPSDAIFSPNRILSSHCQDYFLFIGRLSRSNRGRKALERTNIYQYLMDLVSVTSHDCYIKLIVSSLDYTRDGLPRIILTKILTATSESARVYSTRFMRVLVRLQLPDFHKWGMELLVSQLYDKSHVVSSAALNVLDEACELQVNIEALVHMRPSLLHLGDRGLLLLIRFIALPSGFKFLSDANFVSNELERWKKRFNVKYVRIVEDEINESLTHHQRGKDGSYGRRTSQRHLIGDVFVPHHLYAQLAQHKAGLELLREKNCISVAVDHVRGQKLDTAEQILDLKASLWALGHIGTSEDGVLLLNDEQIIPELVKLAEECPVYAIRGTCFYVLGLLAATRTGSDLLRQLGWEALRRSRHEKWPPVKELDLIAMDDCLSSVGSLNSQFADLETEDGYNGILHRLDECIDSDGREDDKDSNDPQQVAHFVLSKFDESDGGDDNGMSDSLDSSRVESRNNWSPVQKEELVTLRKAYALQSPVIKRTEVNSSNFRKWSNTLPLIRHRPTAMPESLALLSSAANSGPRQRSRSVVQRPMVSEAIVEAWERRTRLAAPEVFSSQQSSPKGSSRLRPKLKIAVRERVRSRSFTEARNNLDVNVIGGHEQTKHLRSSSNIEIRLKEGCTAHGCVVINGQERGELSRDSGTTSQNASLKDRRCDSNESSRTSTSKSRSNSCTDSTSGFSSCESGNVRVMELRMGINNFGRDSQPHLLSPIPSSGSINTMSGRTVHHSDVTRKMVNLRNTPVVLNRVSTSRNLGSPRPASLSEVHSQETSFTYTTTRDAQGYATLRSLQQRRRGFSTCVPPDPQMLYHNLRATKTRSLDSRLEIPRILTYDSLSSLGVSNLDRQHSVTCSTTTTHVVKPDIDEKRYVGLCLPVDISMIFNEDPLECCDRSRIAGEQRLTKRSANSTLAKPRVEPVLTSEETSDGFDFHISANCMGCCCINRASSQPSSVGRDSSVNDLTAEASPVQANASETSTATTPGSISSISSCDPGQRGLDVDSFTGKSLIRKEVIRFIIKLSSSVATKSSEQGLLNLKQKFPMAFHDLCLYTDVCHMMARYNFRLSARRFIQELFLDLSFDKFYEEAFHILCITDKTESASLDQAMGACM